ncbi:MAG: rRNA maturation RNase YbeY [Phycisphaerae bacterium]|jgi:probable rRNA maturation factor
MKPKVAISSSQKAIRVPRKKIAELVAFVARAEGARIAEIDLAVVASSEISSLNRRFLSHAGPTDVLSFDISESGRGGISAQLVVCGDVAAQQARARRLPAQRELLLYVTHGLLHLMGYEDSSIRGAAKMHAREEELLEGFLGKKVRSA